MSEARAVIGQHKPRVEQFQFGPWKLMASKSHILVSEGPDREKYCIVLIIMFAYLGHF